MSVKIEELTDDQKRRIVRDFLKGIPKERITKKHDISDETLFELVGIYAKRKHPNDVGGAKDISGPLDLIVSRLDTGSTATEYPVVARNPRDLRVAHERVVEEYDYEGLEEQRRVRGGEISDAISQREAEKRKGEADEVREAIKENKEATDAILRELDEESKALAEDRKDAAAQKAAEAPDPEEIRRLAREAAEKQVIADQAGEAAIDQTRLKYAQDNIERDKKLVEEGKKQNEQLQKEQDEARQKEAEQRAADHDKLRKEAESARQELAGLTGEAGVGGSGGPDEGSGGEGEASDKRGSGAGSAGDNQPTREEADAQSGQREGANGQGGGDSGTKPSAGGDSQAGQEPVIPPAPEPAKVEPDGLTKKAPNPKKK